MNAGAYGKEMKDIMFYPDAESISKYFSDNGYEGQAADEKYCQKLADRACEWAEEYEGEDFDRPLAVELVEEVVKDEIENGFRDYYASKRPAKEPEL